MDHASATVAPATMPYTLERPRELRRVLGLLSPVPPHPSLLLLEGDHGIGKTTLWRAALDALCSECIDVRSATCTPSDARLSLMTLAELLSPIEGPALQSMPERLRGTLLTGALRVAPDRPIEPALLVTATRRFVEELASAAPLVLGIDDVQWLDACSARVIGGALRQIDPRTPVAVFATALTGSLTQARQPVASVRPEAFTRLTIPRLPKRAIDRILQERIGSQLSRLAHDRIIRLSHGNPLFALEIARGLVEHGGVIDPLRPLPVAADLRQHLATRLAALPSVTRRVLLVAALASRPTVSLLERACPSGARVDTALRRALRAEIIDVIRGEVRFVHPLLGSVLASEMSVAERTTAHRRLAAASRDPEERARHLALASTATTESVAAIIEEGGRWSERRGTPAVAADLFAAAAARTPATESTAAARRRRAAARNLVMAGRTPEAIGTLRGEVEDAPPGEERARALLELGRASFVRDPTAFIEPLEAELAIDDPTGRADLEVEIRTFLAFAKASGDAIAGAREHAMTAVALAERLGDQSLLAAALMAHAFVELRSGRPPARETLDRVLALEIPARRFPAADDPHTQVASLMSSIGDHGTAARILRGQLVHARACGDDASTSLLLGRLATAEIAAGRWADAEVHLQEATLIARETGVPPMLTLASLGWLEASMGDRERGLRHVEESVVAANQTSATRIQVLCEGMLGSTRFCVGDASSAAQGLVRTVARIRELRQFDPDLLRFGGDEVEALVALGRQDDGRHDVATLLRHARPFGPGVRGTAARAHGLVLGADGDLDRAGRVLAAAVQAHTDAGHPFERGRSLLALGSVQRRARHSRVARDAIDEAITCFDALGANTWTERARRERLRITGRAPAALVSAGDQQIIELVAKGLTNREIAQTLFLGTSTVEAHLRSIYRELGVRSRAELAARTSRGDAAVPSSR